MTRKQKRLAIIGAMACVVAIAAGLVGYFLNETFVYFKSPTEVKEQQVKVGQRIRLGGLVKRGSREDVAEQTVQFVVTDMASDVTVRYRGLLPNLFEEGQGVVTEGALNKDGVFIADTVLAKHDENYMPPEVADALKKQGLYKGPGS